METPPTIEPARPSEPAKPDRTWEVLCHAAAFSGFIGVPFGNILGPLIVWSIKKEEIPSVNEHGKESLNFQITCAIAFLGLALLALLCFVGMLIPLIGLLFMVLIWVLMAAGGVIAIATVKAGNGEFYRYPFSFRFIK
jgi:uncharacterized Tic20 family protein